MVRVLVGAFKPNATTGDGPELVFLIWGDSLILRDLGRVGPSLCSAGASAFFVLSPVRSSLACFLALCVCVLLTHVLSDLLARFAPSLPKDTYRTQALLSDRRARTRRPY